MAERIDIYNANLEHLGVLDRVEAHQRGEWHRTFHCWIVSGQDGGRLLLQKRATPCATFPACSTSARPDTWRRVSRSSPVAALVWLPIAPGMELFSGTATSLTLRGYTFEKSAGARWETFELPITSGSFVPRLQRYYLTALIMAERLLGKAGPLAIS